VSFSTIPGYLSNRKEWQKWLPADFITESFPGQFKNWFYSLIAMSTALEDMEPTKTILGHATLLGEDGRPMHKSWGNSIEFEEGADKIGVDVMRWMYARQNPSDNLLFGYKMADEVRRKFHLKFWNVYNFFVTYANLDGYVPSKKSPSSLSVLDKWILARLDQTIDEVTNYLEAYDAYVASASIEKFVDDLSLWYIRRSRDRVGPAAEEDKDKQGFYSTTYVVLTTLSTILAPFMPFMPDFMYKNLVKGESVHLESWPTSSKSFEKESKLIEEMEIARQVVEKAHAIRKEKQFPVRQPLSLFETTLKPISKQLEYLIKEEINVKKIIWNAKKNRLETKITKELEEEAKVRELIRNIQEERKNMKLNLTQKVDVTSDWVPMDKKLVQWLMLKAQIGKITKGKFHVKLSV
jgi:isoleucyl-tRNA synthetase